MLRLCFLQEPPFFQGDGGEKNIGGKIVAIVLAAVEPLERVVAFLAGRRNPLLGQDQ